MITYDLSKRDGMPKYEFLYRSIRSDIRSGTLPVGTKLPAKRALARHLSVSISTVEAAFDLLVEQGYAQARQGSGFYVTDLYRKHTSSQPSSPSQTLHSANSLMRVSHDESRTTSASHPLEKHSSDESNAIVPQAEAIDFSANRASMNLFPADTWSRIMRNVLSERDPSLFETVPYNGLLALRKAIASHLYEFKGIRTHPEQIVIGAGTEYLYGRLLQLFGPRAIIAAGSAGARKLVDISRTMGVAWDFIPVDDDGLCADRLWQSTADIVHVSPANHFPTAVVMSPKRREILLHWAYEQEHHYIIEDDYDSELRYYGSPLPTLFSQDTQEKTIYLNTFSKTLVPSLRISYMVLPQALAHLYERQLSFYSCTVSSFEQLALASFLSNGYFERHINRLIRYYGTAREELLRLLNGSPLMRIAKPRPVPVGTHLILHVNTTRTDAEIREEARRRGLHLAMLSDYCVTPTVYNIHEVVINFASVDVGHLADVIAVIEDIFAPEIQATLR